MFDNRASFQYIQYSRKRWFIFPIPATFSQAEPLPLITPGQGYPVLHATPKVGTYERWYVANTGNAQPVTNDVVDMNPFHIHPVNFTVTRHDTVRIQSNELVELLVFFLPGYIAVIMCITVILWSMKTWE